MDYQTFLEWIQGEYIDKVVLLDINYYDVETGSEKTLFLSTAEYTTSDTDLPDKLQPYSSVVRSGISFSSQLNLQKFGYSFNWGTIAIDNSDGWMDSIIRNSTGQYNIFKNRLINIYVGDFSWPKSDFQKVMSVLIDDIDIRSVNEVTIRFKDSMQLLNQAVNINTSDNSPRTLNDLYKDKHAGADMPSTNRRYEDREAALPVCFGECFNIQPLSIDWVYADDTVSGNYYMLNDGPIYSVISVRDNGVQLPTTSYEVLASLGIIKLNRSVFGTLTCDVQGTVFNDVIKVNPVTGIIDELTGTQQYLDDPINIVLNLIAHYGIIQNRIQVQNFDAVNIASLVNSTYYSSFFGTRDLTRVGYFGNSSANILSICNDMLNSISCQMVFNTNSKLSIVSITTPELSTKSVSNTITLSDIELDGLTIKDVIAPSTNIERLGYAKNYTPNMSLVFTLEGTEKDSLTREYLEIASNLVSEVPIQYNLPKQKSSITTCLLIETIRAQQEVNRRAAMACRRSLIVDISMTPKAYGIELGDKVVLQHYRFNLSNVECIVIGKSQDITTNSYILTLLV